MSDEKTLVQLAEQAWRTLPQGWEIRVTMKRGFMGVELIDPDGDSMDRTLDTIAGSLEMALNTAIALAG